MLKRVLYVRFHLPVYCRIWQSRNSRHLVGIESNRWPVIENTKRNKMFDTIGRWNVRFHCPTGLLLYYNCLYCRQCQSIGRKTHNINYGFGCRSKTTILINDNIILIIRMSPCFRRYFVFPFALYYYYYYFMISLSLSLSFSRFSSAAAIIKYNIIFLSCSLSIALRRFPQRDFNGYPDDIKTSGLTDDLFRHVEYYIVKRAPVTRHRHQRSLLTAVVRRRSNNRQTRCRRLTWK